MLKKWQGADLTKNPKRQLLNHSSFYFLAKLQWLCKITGNYLYDLHPHTIILQKCINDLSSHYTPYRLQSRHSYNLAMLLLRCHIRTPKLIAVPFTDKQPPLAHYESLVTSQISPNIMLKRPSLHEQHSQLTTLTNQMVLVSCHFF